MDQDPLPRGSSQVADRLAQVLDVVLELSRTTVAVEAENATYITEYVIVIDVPRVWRAADRANAAGRGQKFFELLLPDRVPPAQITIPGASMEALNGLQWLGRPVIDALVPCLQAPARQVADAG